MFNSNFKLTPSGSGAKQSESNTASAFVQTALKMNNTHINGNGGVALKSSLNDFLDQFGNASSYREIRSYEDIANDMNLIYSQDKAKALKLTMYLRMVSRKIELFDGSTTEMVQNGQGLKHEGIMRMLWVAMNDPKTFQSNLELFVCTGSFNDVIKMMAHDLKSHGFENRKLDWKFLGNFIMSALSNENVADLVKKYLPQIKSSSKQKTQDAIADTIIAKYLASVIFGGKEGDFSTYKKYRQLKASGNAHQWQQLISKRLFNEINFKTVAGRALASMTGSKFLANQGLEDKFISWIESQPTAKFTGYPYELLAPVKQGYRNASLSRLKTLTINKQFETLVQLGRDGLSENENGFIAVVDTSSSMTSNVSGLNVSSYDVAKSMALYMSEVTRSNKFANSWIEFNSKATLHVWKGSTPVEKLQNDRAESYGSTNIIGVAKLFVDILKQGVSESDFPSGIVCFSDGCFDQTGDKLAFTKFRKEMVNGGFSKKFVEDFKIVLWDIPNGYYNATIQPIQFYADQPNSYSLGGLDGSVLKFVLGTEEQVRTNSTPKTPEELMDAALSQQILQLVRIPR